MKVLPDTCVWSLALRRHQAHLSPDERRLVSQLSEAIQDGQVVIVGPIRQELLSGIREDSHFARIQLLLEPFLDEQLVTEDYVEAARLFNLCRQKGVQAGPVDMLLCAIAVRRRCAILTYDQGLLRCIQILKANRLVL